MGRFTIAATLCVCLLSSSSAFAQGISDACTDRNQCREGFACFEGNCLDDGKFVITLSWPSNADLDLTLKTPTGAEISPALEDSITADGGTLRRDECYNPNLCEDNSGHLNVEHISWSWGDAMPEGNYEVWVTNFDGREASEYTITVGQADGSQETFTGGVAATAGAESEHHVFTGKDSICEADTDKDGICDKWELEGIDIDDDGTIDYDLPSMGVDPNHKDMFVEVDHFKGEKVFPLGAVVTAFASAPVDNPDGLPGIKLHLQMDEEVDSIAGTPVTAGMVFDHNDIAKVKYGTANEADDSNSCAVGWFGTAAERASANCPAIMKARKQIYRYTIYVSELSIGGYSGVAELAGNDLVVSVGAWGSDNTQAVQQGTFMHELGHTLRLGHGGGDHQNCKTNHLSVMNYTYQFPTSYAGRPLAYGPRLPDLDESALVEADGIQGPASWAQVVFVGPASLVTSMDNASQPQDYNQDMDATDTVSQSISSGAFPCGGAASPGVLQSIDEWKALRLNVRSTGGWNAVFPGVDFGTGEATEELDDEAYRQMAAGSDSDEDGLSNLDDNCATVANPEQEDADDDGVGDACDMCPDAPAPGYIDGCPEGPADGPATTDPDDPSGEGTNNNTTGDDGDPDNEGGTQIQVDKGCSTIGSAGDVSPALALLAVLAFGRPRRRQRRAAKRKTNHRG